MRVEEKYADVPQSIEYAIVRTYQECPGMSDYAVMRALEALIDAYSGEGIGRPPRAFALSDLERRLVEEMRRMCEWRLGRGEPLVGKMPAGSGPTPISRDEIILSLKRILKSVKRWNKEGGERGYPDFIIQYIG